MSSDHAAVDGAVTALLQMLRRENCQAELIAPGVPMPTVPLAAAAIGVLPEQILKSILFADGSGETVLAIASGTGRVNRRRLAAVAGLGRLSLADAGTVCRITGYPVGGVAPVGHAERVPVVIDRRVIDLSVAYGGGGADHLLLKIAPNDILRLTGGVIADIVDPAG